MRIMFAVTLLAITFQTKGFQHQSGDSVSSDTSAVQGGARTTKRITMRFQSIGFFNFSGRICSSTPAADLNLYFQKRGLAVSVFAAKDLTSFSNDNNFAFALLQKRFAVSKAISVTTHAGLLMDHFTRSFGDRLLLTTGLKCGRKLSVDHTSLMANAMSRQEKEWVNRIRVIHSQTHHIQLIFSTWHNTAIFDPDQYVSAAMQASYNRIEISPNIYLHTSVSFFALATSTEEVPDRERNGLLLTVGFSYE